MIIKLLFTPLFVLIKFMLGLVPTINPVTNGLISSVTAFTSFITELNYFVPIGTVFFGLGTLLFIDSFSSVLWLFNFVIKKIPTI